MFHVFFFQKIREIFFSFIIFVQLTLSSAARAGGCKLRLIFVSRPLRLAYYAFLTPNTSFLLAFATIKKDETDHLCARHCANYEKIFGRVDTYSTRFPLIHHLLYHHHRQHHVSAVWLPLGGIMISGLNGALEKIFLFFSFNVVILDWIPFFSSFKWILGRRKRGANQSE